MKSKKLFIGLLSLVVIIFSLFIYFTKKAEWKPTEENLINYEAVYHEFSVRFLRDALDAYVANDSKSVCILDAAVYKFNGKDKVFEGITSGLDAFDKSYYRSKFIVWSFTENSENGNNIMILFRDKPDRLFYAWVGRNPEGEICLMGFNSRDDTDKKALEKTIKSLKPSIYDTKYGI